MPDRRMMQASPNLNSFVVTFLVKENTQRCQDGFLSTMALMQETDGSCKYNTDSDAEEVRVLLWTV
eukprot:scaffold178074_cov23-Tisochrysis_lutea.AAC.1